METCVGEVTAASWMEGVFCAPVSQVLLFLSTLFLFSLQNILVGFKINLFNTLT